MPLERFPRLLPDPVAPPPPVAMPRQVGVPDFYASTQPVSAPTSSPTPTPATDLLLMASGEFSVPHYLNEVFHFFTGLKFSRAIIFIRPTPFFITWGLPSAVGGIGPNEWYGIPHDWGFWANTLPGAFSREGAKENQRLVTLDRQRKELLAEYSFRQSALSLNDEALAQTILYARQRAAAEPTNIARQRTLLEVELIAQQRGFVVTGSGLIDRDYYSLPNPNAPSQAIPNANNGDPIVIVAPGVPQLPPQKTPYYGPPIDTVNPPDGTFPPISVQPIHLPAQGNADKAEGIRKELITERADP